MFPFRMIKQSMFLMNSPVYTMVESPGDAFAEISPTAASRFFLPKGLKRDSLNVKNIFFVSFDVGTLLITNENKTISN